MAGSGELTACSHPEPHKARRLINRVNCKEGTLSKQADLTHCGIKEYPSLETPSLTPSTCNKIKNPQHQDLLCFSSHRALHKARYTGNAGL